MTIFTKSNDHLQKLVPLLGILEFGHSKILINSSNEQHNVEIKIKKNIKLSSKLINDISRISGVDYLTFS